MSTTNYTTLVQFDKDTYIPDFDPLGTSVDNKVLNEIHTIQAESASDWQVLIPLFSPFFADGLSVSFKPEGESVFTPLVMGVDYFLVYQYIDATRSTGKAVFGGISLTNNTTNGQVRFNQYQTIGGSWVINLTKINQILADKIQNPKITSWEQIAQVPVKFPVTTHEYDLQDQVGASAIVQAIEGISTAISELPPNPDLGAMAAIQDHLADADDPHPQYITEEELANLLADNAFKGAFIGVANLTGTTYSLPDGNTYTDNIGVFSIQFNQENPAGCSLVLPGGTPRPITDESGKAIPDKEIAAGENRILISVGSRYILAGIKKYLSLPFSTGAFADVEQNEAVRFNNGGLSKAIANGIAPNNAVIGFADKEKNKVVYSGMLSGFSGLTVDATYYLSDVTPGAITTTKPKIDAIIVGTAKSATELYVSIMAAAANEFVPIGGGDDKVWYGNDKLIRDTFVLPANKNYLSTGPIEIEDDVNLVLPDSTNWVII